MNLTLRTRRMLIETVDILIRYLPRVATSFGLRCYAVDDLSRLESTVGRDIAPVVRRSTACRRPPARSLEFERSIKATSRRQQQQQQLQQRRRRRRRRQQWIDRYTRPDERCFSSRDGQPAGSYSRTAAEEKHRPTTTTPSALTLISARPREHVF